MTKIEKICFDDLGLTCDSEFSAIAKSVAVEFLKWVNKNGGRYISIRSDYVDLKSKDREGWLSVEQLFEIFNNEK